MFSLSQSSFLNGACISRDRNRRASSFLARRSSTVKIVAVNSNSNNDLHREGQEKKPAFMASNSVVNEMRENAAAAAAVASSSTPSVVDENESTIAGGARDVYGEDAATEDQFVIPWTLSVASGYTLLRDPHHNKGLAFTEKERDAHYLRGLLPPTVVSQDLQVKKMMHSIQKYQVPLKRYMALMELQVGNSKLFYKLLIENVEELLPVVYTPTVGEACQKYGSIFRRLQGLFISLREKGKILEVLRNWPEKNIQVIVVTDGERICWDMWGHVPSCFDGTNTKLSRWTIGQEELNTAQNGVCVDG